MNVIMLLVFISLAQTIHYRFFNHRYGLFQVESGALVAAGAVVQPNTTVAAGQVWGGNPARFIRDLKPHEKSFMQKSAEAYCALGADHFKATKDGPAGFAGL